jgi:YD repeat-containing protein
MATRPVSQAPAPFIAPAGVDIDERLALIAQAINTKANAGGAGPAYHFIGLVDATGQTWRLTVDTAGGLVTELVPRP